MAIRDFRKYMGTLRTQYLELKSDLADYDAAFRDGHFTEEQLEDLKANVAIVEENYNRLLYVDWLLNLPNRKEKKAKAIQKDNNLKEWFAKNGATDAEVFAENDYFLKEIRDQLKALVNKEKEK